MAISGYIYQYILDICTLSPKDLRDEDIPPSQIHHTLNVSTKMLPYLINSTSPIKAKDCRVEVSRQTAGKIKITDE